MGRIRCQSRAESFVFETVVPVSLGSDESIRKFGFAVRLLCVEEIGLLLYPTGGLERALLQGHCSHQHPVLFCE